MSFLTIIGICIGIAFLLVAYFAGIEVAFTSANRLNIELKKKQGASSGILLSNLFDNPSRFIGTNVVGFSFFLTVVVLLGSVDLDKLEFNISFQIHFFVIECYPCLAWLLLLGCELEGDSATMTVYPFP